MRIGYVAAIVSILAGAYLLTSQSEGSESNWFELLGHGIGAYMIARGLFMIGQVRSDDRQEALLERIADNLGRPTPPPD